MKNLLEALIPFARRRPEPPVPSGVPPKSIHRLGGAAFAVTRDGGSGKLLAVADCAAHLPEGFAGETVGLSNRWSGLIGPLSEQNAAALRRHFPWCAPRALPRDRVAVAAGPGETEALLRAAAEYRFAPVLARCPERGGERNFRSAADEAAFAVFSADFRDGWGADGGLLGTPDQWRANLRHARQLPSYQPPVAGWRRHRIES